MSSSTSPPHHHYPRSRLHGDRSHEADTFRHYRSHSHRHTSRSRSRERGAEERTSRRHYGSRDRDDRDRGRHGDDRVNGRDSGRDKDRDHKHRHRDRSRSRSRSRKRARQSRSTSPSRKHHKSSREKDKEEPKLAPILPHRAPYISKNDYEAYKDLFASYLSIQKEINFDEIDHREKKGRFKQFVKRWNSGELSRGWYDPERRKKAKDLKREVEDEDDRRPKEGQEEKREEREVGKEEDDDSEEDIYGPTLPGQVKVKHKVTLPTSDDLALQKELEEEARLDARADLAFARKLDRKRQKEALDELVPRAEAGTRERQLEKKRETNEKMRAFRDKSPGADMDLDEGTLMGGGGTDSFQAKKALMERKKNERELRKEALLRQRMQEREERLEEVRKREEKTMELLFAMRDTMFAKRSQGLDSQSRGT